MHMQYDEVLGELQLLSDPAAVAGMARFGINPANCYGISMVKLRKLAKQIGKNHKGKKSHSRSGPHPALTRPSPGPHPPAAGASPNFGRGGGSPPDPPSPKVGRGG